MSGAHLFKVILQNIREPRSIIMVGDISKIPKLQKMQWARINNMNAHLWISINSIRQFIHRGRLIMCRRSPTHRLSSLLVEPPYRAKLVEPRVDQSVFNYSHAKEQQGKWERHWRPRTSSDSRTSEASNNLHGTRTKASTTSNGGKWEKGKHNLCDCVSFVGLFLWKTYLNNRFKSFLEWIWSGLV